MALEGKISVKHYLNKKLKPIIKKGKKTYPLYVRLSFKNKFTEFKSRYFIFSTVTKNNVSNVDELTEFLKIATFNVDSNDVDLYYSEDEFEKMENSTELQKERDTLRDIIDTYRVQDINIIEEKPQEIINKCLIPIDQSISEQLKKGLRQSITGSKDFEVLAEIIDWDSPYHFIYFSLLSIASREFKNSILEKHSNDYDLFIQLKRFLSAKDQKLWIYQWKSGTLKKEIMSNLEEPTGKKVVSMINTLYKSIFIQ